VFPGFVGGMHWGSLSYDPRRGLLIVNTNRLAFVVTLVPRERYTEERAAAAAHRFREVSPQRGTPYAMYREPLLSARGVPCNAPPWGTLAAVDVATGDVRWEVPLGTWAPLPGSDAWGSLNLGGALTTAGGLVFIAAARDPRLRAFDVDTGTTLWSAELPAGAQATPMTYRTASGRQFVVIAAGGHSGLGSPMGDHVVAFALP
jgi:quinoprotein glucose dehydrogenase